jgi:ketosteroid isomerase-like protein
MLRILLLMVLGTLVVSAAAKDELLEADREFGKAVAARGIDGWVECFAEDGKMFPAGGEVVEGKKAVRELMAARFAQPGFSLHWTPLGAELARSGDFGYTYGMSESRFTGKDGKLIVATGKYITVWRKEKNGAWKVIADIGNATPRKPSN